MGKAWRLLDLVRERIRVKHFPMRNEDTCLQWIRRFIGFQGMRQPRELGPREIEALCTDLDNSVSSSRPRCLPVVLTTGEVARLIADKVVYTVAARWWARAASNGPLMLLTPWRRS